MSCLKKMVFVIAAVFLMFCIACGDNKGGNKNDNNNQLKVSITIQSSLTVRVGESRTVPVSTQNTGFTVSVNPASGSGCTKDGDAVTCRPTASGTYTVTVTATADTSKAPSMTVRVPELEIDGEDELAFYADETESGDIAFYAAGDWEATVVDSEGGVPDWIEISSPAGSNYMSIMAQSSGSGTTIQGSAGYNSIIVTLALNFSGKERAATIIITTTNGQIKITIIQEAVTEDGTTLTPEMVTVSISPRNASIILGDSRTFTVTAQNTDFILSVRPTSGSGCVKSGVGVVCTPTATGTYDVTVTSTADTAKTSTSVFTVLPTVTVSINMTPPTASVTLGEPRTFAVAAQNTGFTLSVSPASGSGCVKSGDSVVCTPTAEGAYNVTVTATADATKTATSVLTVAKSVDQLINSGHAALKNKQYDEAVAYYERAYEADNNYVKAVIYSTLGKIAQISTDPKVMDLLKNRLGFTSYPNRLNALLDTEWLKEYAEYREFGYYDDTLKKWVYWYDEWAVEEPFYQGIDKAGYYYEEDNSCSYDNNYPYFNYCKFVFVSDVERYTTISLPELLIPGWVTGGSDSWYNETLFGDMPGFDTWILLLCANILDKNPAGINNIIDDLIPAIFDGSFVDASTRVKNLETHKNTTITLDVDFIAALHLGEFIDEYDPIGWAELNGITSAMLIVKGALEYVASYDLNTDLSFMKYAWINNGNDFYVRIKEVDPKNLPFNNSFMNARTDGATRMGKAKNSFITAIQGFKASYDAILESPLYPTAVKDAYPTINEGIEKLLAAIQNGGKFWIPEDPTKGAWPTSGGTNVLAGVDMGKFFQAGYFSLKNVFETEEIDGQARPVLYAREYRSGYSCPADQLEWNEEYNYGWCNYWDGDGDGYSYDDYINSWYGNTVYERLTNYNYSYMLDLDYSWGCKAEEAGGMVNVQCYDRYGDVGMKLKAEMINGIVFDSPDLYEELPELIDGSGGPIFDFIPRDAAKIVFKIYYDID
ncbi:MAG: hypothetical protein FWF15_08245 [Oscillospiraceae bacterium]|nr:hypothetical protein [Oscillospiraceae bacterium]